MFPLSFQQQRVWELSRVEAIQRILNIGIVRVFTGRFQRDLLPRVIKELLKRHEVLRTVIRIIDSEPFQYILEIDDVESREVFRFTDLTSQPEESSEDSAYEIYRDNIINFRFNLSQGPLFKINVIRLHNNRVMIFLIVHHIICDQQSLGILWRDMIRLYNACISGETITSKPVCETYGDFAGRQRQEYENGILGEAEEYWRSEFSSAAAPLNLPIDFPLQSKPSYHGAHCIKQVGLEMKILLEKMSIKNRVSFLATILSAYYLFLYKITSNDDLVVGTLFPGRDTPAMVEAVGLFVNMTALRMSISRDMYIKDFIKQVNKKILEGYKYQYFPMEKIVEIALPGQRGNAAPLFQTILNIVKDAESPYPFIGLGREEVRVDIIANEISTYDLSIIFVDKGKDAELVLEYRADLFKKETIRHLINLYERILNVIAGNCEIPVSALDVYLPGEEGKEPG